MLVYCWYAVSAELARQRTIGVEARAIAYSLWSDIEAQFAPIAVFPFVRDVVKFIDVIVYLSD